MLIKHLSLNIKIEVINCLYFLKKMLVIFSKNKNKINVKKYI